MEMNERLEEACKRLSKTGIVDEDLLPRYIDFRDPPPDPELVARLERSSKHSPIYEVVRNKHGEILQTIIVPAKLARREPIIMNRKI